MNNFFEELKNRNVYKVATAYAIGSWLVIQVVDTIGPNLNWSDSIAPLVTKILIIGFPIALVLTWLYEFTPQGLKLTGKVQAETSDNRRAGKRLNRITITVLSLLIIVLLIDKLFISGPVLYDEQQTASIGVLPFVNMSGDDEYESYADGLSEQLLDELAQISGLQVPARTSSFQFKNKNSDVRYIAEQLGVNYILEGSIRFDRARNRMRITTQLINASNGFHLWSNTYDEQFETAAIFDVQENVSRKVARELKVRLLPSEELAMTSRTLINTDAYKLYLRSRKYSVERNDEDLGTAINLLNKALVLEPNFAEAHAELSFLYGQRFFYGNLKREERDTLMAIHVQKAIAIDSLKPEVLRARARYKMGVRQDSSQVIRDLRKAIKLKPNYSDAHYLLYQALSWARQPNVAHLSLERSVKEDPLNGFFANILAREYFWTYREHEKAFAILDRLIKIDKWSGAARFKSLMLADEPYGDKVQAFKLTYPLFQKDPYVMGNINYNLLGSLELDITPLAEKLGRIFQLRYPDNEAHTYNNILWLYAFNRDYDDALDHIMIWKEEKNLDETTAATDLAWINSITGNNQKALELFENTFPELTEPTLTPVDLDRSTSLYLISYIEYLRIDGQVGKADILASTLCGYYMDLIENNPRLRLMVIRDFKLDCSYASNDIENFLSVLEDSYFKRKSKRDIFGNLHGRNYRLFEDNRRYKELVKRITEDTHRMRAEVITYLKEEGDWNPAWDKELGLE